MFNDLGAEIFAIVWASTVFKRVGPVTVATLGFWSWVLVHSVWLWLPAHFMQWGGIFVEFSGSMDEALAQMALGISCFLVGLYDNFEIEKFSCVKYFFCMNTCENGKAEGHWFGLGVKSFYYFHFKYLSSDLTLSVDTSFGMPFRITVSW